MNQPAPPTKLFREEAKTGSVQCLACGAPITLRGFAGIEQVTCAFCGTAHQPEPEGPLHIIQHASRQRRPSVLPLYQRGSLDLLGMDGSGASDWEIIGLSWREMVKEGITYPWQEFLLFNPYQGFRWLIYSMSDGIWSVGGPLPGAAKMVANAWPSVEYKGESYKHHTSGNARTTYVEGEFPWQVLAGDSASTNDYVCPPKLISIELQRTKQGADLNFTQMRPIAAAEVWAAFRMPGSPPAERGIHPAAPNPVAANTRFYLIAAAALIIVWVLATVVYAGGRANHSVWKGNLPANGTISEEVSIGEPGEVTTIELELQASGMNNSWAYAEVLLINPETEEATVIGVEAEYYSGVDGGESWSEGSNPGKQTVGGIPGGKYLMQVNNQVDPGGDPADMLTLDIREDVPLYRYVLIPLLVIFTFPLINFIRRAAFEKKRWSESDHAPVEANDD
ncbi:DUF4178 domain-containing protein [Nannocystaceae bacterium ST9]